MRKQLWTISGIAVELDRDRRTIADALSHVSADGEKAGRSAWFMTSAIRALSSASDGDGLLDPAQERARKDRALAVATELKNDLAIGKVVLIDVAMAAVTVQHRKLRNKLLSLPIRIASRVPEQVRAQVFDLAETEVLAAMAALTTGGEGNFTLAEVEVERSLAAPDEEPAHV